MVYYPGKKCLFAALLAASYLAVPQAHALVKDPMIDTARLCTKHFPRHERIQGIPTHLLAAIAATESGRWNKTLGMVIPWPWTINAEGQGFYFESKAEAIRKVRKLQRQGIKSIDIGCMQVNLKHHPNAFSSLEQAFDPKYNVTYAAQFLRNNYDEMRSWTMATAAYHSRTPKYGSKYLNRIEKSWNTIVAKVRDARAKRGITEKDYVRNAKVQNEERDFAALAQDFKQARRKLPIYEAEAKATSRKTASRKKAKKHPIQKSIKVIEVSDAPSSRRQTTIIRPTNASNKPAMLKADSGEALQTVAATDPELFVLHYGSTSSKSVTSKSSSATSKSKKSGPKFVFVE